MLTINKVFTILCLLSLPVWGNSEYLLFFQMSAQVYSVPGQTEGRRKVFLEWKSIADRFILQTLSYIRG